MDEQTFTALLAPEGQRLLAEAMRADLADAARLRELTRLRRVASPALATAALETAVLRQRAAAKFSRAAAMYFTREALEQASGELPARHRARRFAGCERVLDLGCGVGGDTLALAAVGRTVGVERDPLRLLMARENARAYDLSDVTDWLRADIREGGPARADVAFVDPARRAADSRRVFDGRAYQPPLGEILGWRRRFSTLAVKVAPGISDAEAGQADEAEFVAVGLELKEAVLWCGAAATQGRRATLLPGGATLFAEQDPAAPLAPAGAFLYEPNAAVIRAHLIGTLAGQLGAWQIDPSIAYLSGDSLVQTPFARAWRIEAVLPFSVDGVRRHLRALGVGVVTVKKRGSPLEPEAFAKLLRLKGPEQRTVALTRQLGRPVALICAATPSTPA